MTRPQTKWSKQVDRVVKRTAARLSADMDRMVSDLPEGAAPQMALELVIDELTQLQPWSLELIMENHSFREAHESSVAMRPAIRPCGDKPMNNNAPKITHIIVEAPDPMVHAVYSHRSALKRLAAACERIDSVQAKREGREITNEDCAEWKAADKAERDALAEMFDTPPKTPAGIRELLQYVQGFDAWNPHDLIDCLLRSPALTA
jgi:hypothetical protein